MRANLQIGAELSPPFSTNMHHFKTPQHPNFKSTNNYLENDTPFVLSEKGGIKSENFPSWRPA